MAEDHVEWRRPHAPSFRSKIKWKTSIMVVAVATQLLWSQQQQQVRSFTFSSSMISSSNKRSTRRQRTATAATVTSDNRKNYGATIKKFYGSSSSYQLFGSRLGMASDDEDTMTTTQRQQRQSQVRFSSSIVGGDGDASMNGDLVDTVLSVISSDVVSIVLGLLGLLWVVIHRLTLLDVDGAEALTVQTRTDLLAVLACGSVLLNGVTNLDVTTALAESVVLDGTKLEQPDVKNNFRMHDAVSTDDEKKCISWVLDSLLTASPAKTAVLLQRNDNAKDLSNPWIVSCRAGVLPTAATTPHKATIELPDRTPILDRVGSPGNSKETYLPTLQALPGRFEFFSYLPPNTQLALLIPIPTPTTAEAKVENYNDVLVLGSNTAKSFTPRDIAWCRIAAERIANLK